MARYIQRIALLGKERWIGWEIDGVGTELPGLTLADRVSEEELRARGVKEFTPLSFEMFLGMNADAGPAKQLLDQDRVRAIHDRALHARVRQPCRSTTRSRRGTRTRSC